MIKSLQRIIVALSSLTISTVVLSTTNPVASHGQVSISQNGNITNINQGSDSGVINWDTFNVDTGATVNFIQPNTASWTLNNVSLSYSDIKGTINANGNVILSNPHGILLHNGALIDVNSMIPTTASLNKHDFINRNFSFSVDDANRYGAIINYGNIETDGPVALLASGIENHGVIISHLGDVNLAAGGGYVVDLSGQGLFSVQITGDLVAKARDKDGKALKHAIHNSGQVIAKNGAAIISAKAANNVIDNLLNVNGMVRANSAHMDGGKIVLNSHNGHTVIGGELTVSSDNGSAGTIEILGDEIIIKDTARVLADGKSGGEIYVGGSDKGQGPLPNSKKVKVEDGALISAKGHENQQSGKIILWADDYLEMSGKLDTSVGLDGFIETSSKKDFMIDGEINAGIHGSWLLDPEEIIIAVGNGAYDSTEQGINTIGINWLDDQVGNLKLQASNQIEIRAWLDSMSASSITFQAPLFKINTKIHVLTNLIFSPLPNQDTAQIRNDSGSAKYFHLDNTNDNRANYYVMLDSLTYDKTSSILGYSKNFSTTIGDQTWNFPSFNLREPDATFLLFSYNDTEAIDNRIAGDNTPSIDQQRGKVHTVGRMASQESPETSMLKLLLKNKQSYARFDIDLNFVKLKFLAQFKPEAIPADPPRLFSSQVAELIKLNPEVVKYLDHGVLTNVVGEGRARTSMSQRPLIGSKHLTHLTEAQINAIKDSKNISDYKKDIFAQVIIDAEPDLLPSHAYKNPNKITNIHPEAYKHIAVDVKSFMVTKAILNSDDPHKLPKELFAEVTSDCLNSIYRNAAGNKKLQTRLAKIPQEKLAKIKVSAWQGIKTQC